MKKAILLGKRPDRIDAVWAQDIRAKVAKLVNLDPVVHHYDEVIASPEKFSDVEIILSTWGMPVMTEEEIRTYLPKLECVFYGAGSVQSFARPFLACGVKVFSAWAANAVPVAEYTVAQIILANKGFFFNAPLASSAKRDEARALSTHYSGNYREKVGLIGCGMIGTLVAEMLKSYALEVLVFDPFLSAEKAERLGVRVCSLDELFSECFVVSNHLANNEATQGMLTYRHFSAMRPYATFLNTGRGAQVVEEDLSRTLSERPDLLAILDVTYPEPPAAGHDFYTLDNCILTSHIAGSSGNEVERMAAYMAEELALYLDGAPTRYEVSEKMLETMA